MIANKHITAIVVTLVSIAVLLCVCAMIFSQQISAILGGTGVAMQYESELFDTSEIISINIQIDTNDWDAMLANATAEEFYPCDVDINGSTIRNVGIRPKGNTSLSAIASDPDNDRYSFKLEFDQYVEGQTCFGLDKLVLNNNYADATNMKEALAYDMFHYIGADASLYNYAKVSVNGEYWGVYLALEAVEDSFLLRNYGTRNAALYKPDSMEIGGGNNGEVGGGVGNFGDMTPPSGNTDTPFDPSQQDGGMPGQGAPPQFGDGRTPPESSSQTDGTMPADALSAEIPNAGAGGAMGSMSGSGADLNYTDDELDSYATIWDCEVTDTTKKDHQRVVKALKNISQGTDLASYMDVDNLLKYAAVHITTVNEDSLSGSMAHNYYLYESGGQLNLLPWDYNLMLGGMGSGNNNATSVVNAAIDDAFSCTDFFDTLLENEEYHAQYDAYLQQLVEEYLLGDGFRTFYNRTRSLIDELVKTDPNSLYTYEEYENALETLCEVVTLRGQSIDGQLDGTIPSTEAEQKNSDALIDASQLDLSVMGRMNTGGEMERIGNFGNETNAPDNVSDETGGDITPPEKPGNNTQQVSGEALQPPTDEQAPDSDASVQPNAQTQESNESNGQTQESMPSDDESAEKRGQFPGNRDFTNAQDIGTSGGTQTSVKTIVIYGGCFALLAAALVFVLLYKRKPKKR